MKIKLLLLNLFIVASALNAFSQRLYPDPITIPRYKTPMNQGYGNYKSYALYTYFNTNDELGAEGFYTPYPESVLHSDTLNGDFKIIVQISALKIKNNYVSGDTAYIVPERLAANIKVFDKEGKLFYDESQPGSYCIGTFPGLEGRPIDDYVKRELLKSLISAALPDLLTDFSDTYVSYVKKDPYGRQPSTYLSSLWILKDKADVKELQDSISSIKKVRTPEELKQVAANQINYWKNYADSPDSKEIKDYKTCGIHNTSLLYYILGNTEEGDRYFEIEKGLKGGTEKKLNENLMKSKWQLTSEMLQKPVLTGTFTHPDDMVSTVNLFDAMENSQYLVCSGLITMNDRTAMAGKCLISREPIAPEGQIASLSGNEYNAIIVTLKEERIKTKLANIANIKTGDSFYVVMGKNSLVQSVYMGPKASLYKKILPASTEFYYNKNDNNFKSKPMIGPGKWIKKFYEDCPELVEKIDKKEIQQEEEMMKYYNEKCN